VRAEEKEFVCLLVVGGRLKGIGGLVDFEALCGIKKIPKIEIGNRKFEDSIMLL